MYDQTKKQNEKLTGLKGQMQDMSQDFNDMIKAREEAKRRLQARFEDVYTKIQENKDYTLDQGRKMNEMLNNFQDKFEKELVNLKENLQDQLNSEKQQHRSDMKQADDKMYGFCQQIIRVNRIMLEKMINDQREQRLRQTDQEISGIKNQLSYLQKCFEEEKSTRIQREGQILDTMTQENKKLSEQLDDQNKNRTKRYDEINDTFKYDINLQNQFLEKFQKKSMDEFQEMRDDLESEMDSRFKHQDEMIQNLMKIVKTFQDTLKVVGKDA